MKQIILYFGEGVDGLSGLHCYKALKELLPSYTILRVKAHQLDDIDFSECELFVMPGGRDIFYSQALNGLRAKQLKLYVQNGGSYLGICAGGYFGSKSIEFEREGPLEIIQERELQFFEGRAVGPALGLGKFEYGSYRGADLAYIVSNEQKIACFFNGGCFFEKAESFPKTHILATYQCSGEPAVIECRVGLGLAILSGVHFEYLAANLTTNQLPKEKIEILQQSSSLDFMNQCLNRLLST